MQRARRRFWTLVVSAGAAVVLTAAVASGLFQLAVQAVPGYRVEIERYVREVTGHPVRIGTLALTWRYYYPSLDLGDVALLDADGGAALLTAERLRLGFGFARLVRGEFTPNRLELHGLTLDVRVDEGGRLHVKGMGEGVGAAEPTELLEALAGFSQLRLERCRLNLSRGGAAREAWSFGVAFAELSKGLLGTELDAALTLPATVGESMRIHATIDGDLLEPRGWSGSWEADLSDLVAGPWLTGRLAAGASLEFNRTRAGVKGELEQGRVTAMEVGVRSGKVRAQRAQHRAGFESLEAHARIRFTTHGWTAHVDRFELESAGGHWPGTDVQLEYANRPGEEPVIDIQAEFLRLQDLAPWVAMLPEPGMLSAADGAGGDLTELSVRAQGGENDLRYRVRSKFRDLSLPAAGRAAGFSGARGEVAADETGGRILLHESPVNVELPGLLVTPAVPLEALDGEVEWARRPDGWQVRVPRFGWRLWTTSGSGQVELTLPDDREQSPVLALTAQFQAEDATAAKPLMPRRWGPDLIDWLDRSIVSARAPSATLVITGPLEDFPFEEKPGTFSLDIEARDVLLAYDPAWPPVEQIDADLKFRGNSLEIETTRGTISGNPIRKATARFADFNEPDLVIEGRVEGETARYYDFLSRSPLRDDLQGLLRTTTAQGNAAVDVHLEIPLKHSRDTTARGRIQLDGVDLAHRALPEPIRGLKGDLAFSGKGVLGSGVTATWHGIPLTIDLAPQRDARTRLIATLRLDLDPDGSGPSGLIPEWLLPQMRGGSRWQAEMMMGGRDASPLKLTSDLRGVEILMPPPMGKAESEAVPITLTLAEAGRIPLRITVDYQDRFGADLHLSPAGSEWTLESAALRLGSGPIIDARDPGVSLGGTVAELDAQAWLDELDEYGLDDGPSVFNHADLTIGRLVWGGYALPDARYQWAPEPKGWSLGIVGAAAAGEVRWNNESHGTLNARLDHLTFDRAESAGEESAVDPSALPVLDLDVRKLTMAQTDFGRVVLATSRVTHGQRVQKLEAQGGVLELTGNGEWRRRAGRSTAKFDFEAASPDVAALMRAFDYTANLDAKNAVIKGALSWAPSESGLEWARAEGSINLNFENGQLRAVEPGAGRVLGLVNFYALPRRLTLNFRDVLSSGLGFDTIRGDFTLADGHARTQNLQINGPSLRMDVIGRIGLVDRDYDQTVTVYPDVSAGVTLGSLLLGGPVAGALALIAQEILEKPLDQVTQLSYRVTGSWDNPQVERVDARPATAGPDRTPGPPGKNP